MPKHSRFVVLNESCGYIEQVSSLKTGLKILSTLKLEDGEMAVYELSHIVRATKPQIFLEPSKEPKR